MIPKRITKGWLQEKRACTDQVEVFAKEWPEGAELTCENLVRAVELELDIGWLPSYVLSPRLWKAYYEGTAPLRKAYEEGVAPLWKAYNEGTAQVLADLIEGDA